MSARPHPPEEPPFLDLADRAAGDLPARWGRAEPLFTERHRQVLASFIATCRVDDTARVLDITPTRVYAIFRQVGRKLGLAPSEVRTALSRGEFPPIGGPWPHAGGYEPAPSIRVRNAAGA